MSVAPPDFAGDEARQKLNIVNIVKISQISLTALIRPRAALMLGLAPHPGWPLSSDLVPALVINAREIQALLTRLERALSRVS